MAARAEYDARRGVEAHDAAAAEDRELRVDLALHPARRARAPELGRRGTRGCRGGRPRTLVPEEAARRARVARQRVVPRVHAACDRAASVLREGVAVVLPERTLPNVIGALELSVAVRATRAAFVAGRCMRPREAAAGNPTAGCHARCSSLPLTLSRRTPGRGEMWMTHVGYGGRRRMRQRRMRQRRMQRRRMWQRRMQRRRMRQRRMRQRRMRRRRARQAGCVLPPPARDDRHDGGNGRRHRRPRQHAKWVGVWRFEARHARLRDEDGACDQQQRGHRDTRDGGACDAADAAHVARSILGRVDGGLPRLPTEWHFGGRSRRRRTTSPHIYPAS